MKHLEKFGSRKLTKGLCQLTGFPPRNLEAAPATGPGPAGKHWRVRAAGNKEASPLPLPAPTEATAKLRVSQGHAFASDFQEKNNGFCFGALATSCLRTSSWQRLNQYTTEKGVLENVGSRHQPCKIRREKKASEKEDAAECNRQQKWTDDKIPAPLRSTRLVTSRKTERIYTSASTVSSLIKCDHIKYAY